MQIIPLRQFSLFSTHLYYLPRLSPSTPFLSSFFVGYQARAQSGSTVSSFPRYGPTLPFLSLLPTPNTAWTTQPILMTSSYVLVFTKSSPLPTSLPFQSPTPYWCWIGGAFDAERIAGEYFWLWTAALSSIFFYTLLFFRLRGNIQVDPQDWKRIRVRLHPSSHVLDAPFTGTCREAMAMIWYPICYTILVLPLSIVRWRTFRAPGQQQLQTPFAVTAVVITIFGLSGVVNVVLIMLTRRNLLLFGQRRGVVSTQESRDSSARKFGSGLASSEQGGTLVRGQGSTNAAGGRAPTTSGGSATLPRISLSRSGDPLDLKSIMGAGSNWENTSTLHASSIAFRSVASLGDLSEPVKPGATPAPSPALRTVVCGGSTGESLSLSDLGLGKMTGGSGIRALKSSDEREEGGELGQSLNDVGKGIITSVGMVRRRSLDSEAQTWRSTSQSNSLLEQGERPRKLSHPLEPATSLRYLSSHPDAQLHLVPPSGLPPFPPVPTGSPPRLSAPRVLGVPDSNPEGGLGGISSAPLKRQTTKVAPLTESIQEGGN